MSKQFATLKSNVRHWWNSVKFPITAHTEIVGPPEWSGRHQQAASFLLAVVTALIMLPNLSYPLIEPDETRYAQIALEINKSNDWITPRLDGKPYLDKPPLMYWLTAGSFAFLGNNEFAARLPSVLSSIATVWVVYIMGAKIIGRRAAWLASVSMLLCGGFAVAGRFLILDSLLTLFVTSSLLSGYAAVREPVQSRTHGQRWKWWMLSGIACALGVLTKGPIALILCAPPLAISGWLRQDQTRIRLLHWVVFVIPMVLVCVPWYIAVWRSNPEFGEYFFLEHNLKRFTEGSNHQQPFWFYLPIVFAVMFPASLLLPSLAVFVYSGSIKKQRLRSKDLGFLACAATWILLFFSIASCKLPTYILPAIPLLCLMLGAMLEHNVFNQNIQTRITTYLKPFPQRASLVVLGVTFLAMAIQVHLFKRFDIPTIVAGCVFFVLLSITIWGWNREIAFSYRGWCFVAVVAVAGISFATGRLIPSIAAYRSVNVRLASLVAEHPDASVAFLGKRTHGLELYMNVDNARYFNVADESDFIDFVKRSPNIIVVARSEDLRKVSEGLVFTHKFASDSENKYLFRATMLVGASADVAKQPHSARR